jgi:DNA-3-methyladenine glycosylase I
MCNSNIKSAGVAQIDGRPVLQPAGNRVAPPEAARPLKKSLHKSLSMPASFDNNAAPRPAPENYTRAAAAGSMLPPATPPSVTARATKAAAVAAEKSRVKARKPGAVLPVVTFAALEAFEPAGSIAAAQREHAAQAQAQRKMRIAHYGRTASFSRVEGRVGATATTAAAGEHVPASPTGHDEKRCSFITPYSGKPQVSAFLDKIALVPHAVITNLSALFHGEQTPCTSRTTTRSGECPCTMTSKPPFLLHCSSNRATHCSFRMFL